MKKLIALVIVAAMVVSMGTVAFAAELVLYRELYNGTVGDDVAVLQESLASMGYGVGNIDGVFGNMTDAAVRNFQRDHGLYVDGLVGNLTAGVINSITGGVTGGASAGVVESGSDTGNANQVSGYGSINPNASLSWGSYGSDVTALQTILVGLGYNVGKIDGDFGGMTDGAVKAFQRDNGLYVDGVAGPKTIAVLNGFVSGVTAGSGTSSDNIGSSNNQAGTGSSMGESDGADLGSGAAPLFYIIETGRTLSRGSSGSDVSALQTALKALGYNVGNIDGDFGGLTDAAVKAFQRDHGLYVDGVCGPKTIDALNSIAEAPFRRPESEAVTGIDSNGNVMDIPASITLGPVADTSKPGWYKVGDDWYYKNASGNTVKDCGMTIDGVYCVFDYNGKYVPGAVMSPLTDSFHLTDKYYSRLGQDISVITLHHMAGVNSGEGCSYYFCDTDREVSSNYCIGVDGDISCNVSEEHGSWTSSTHINDEKAICIELSDANWEFSAMTDSTIESLINLSVDLIKRYPSLGGSFNYKADGTGNITLHSMFSAKPCPGPYLVERLPKIQAEVNRRLGR